MKAELTALAILAAFAAAMSAADAEETEGRAAWLVFPAQAAKPPPRDPTMLRLSTAIGEAIQKIVKEDVRVTSRDVRDEHCPQEDGRCAAHVADQAGADRVVSLVLSPAYDKLEVRIYRRKMGVEKEGTIPCAWNEGDVACDTKKLAAILARDSLPPPVDAEAVKKAFDALAPKLARCHKGQIVPGAAASFRVRQDGHVIDVRIQPDELHDDPAYQCVARTIESLRVKPFTGEKPEQFRFSLGPERTKPKDAKSKVDRKKKSG
jgi:hypothetical protein